MQFGTTFIVSDDGFFSTIERQTFTFYWVFSGCLTLFGDVVQSQDHILRRNGNRCTICRVQNVVRCQHQQLSFRYSCVAQRHVNRHLVTIKIRVKTRTNQWVQLNSLALNQLRLESLDTQSVKRRSTVQQHWMTFQYIFQDIPNHRIFFLYDFLRSFYGFYDTPFNQFTNDKRLEQFRSHVLWQSTLVQFECRSYHDYRTTRIVNTLTQQVLTETTLLTFKHIAQRFQRTIAFALHSACTTGVIQQ